MNKSTGNLSLSQWLRKNDINLYSAIEEAEALNLLRSSRRSNGITFLYPQNKLLRENLIKNLEYNEYDDGIRVLQSLIVNDLLQNTNDWHAKRDDIPNKLGLKLDIVSIDRSNIKLSNGANIKKLSDVYNSWVVWSYECAENLPLTGEKSEYKYSGPNKKIIKKEKRSLNKNEINTYKLARICQNQALMNIRKNSYLESNPFLKTIASYLEYLFNKDKKIYNDKIINLSYSPEASFYCIFEPYNKNPIVTEYFNEWWYETKGGQLLSNPAEEYKFHLFSAASLYSSKRKITKQCRNSLLLKKYKNVLRKSLSKLYKSDELNFLHDEIRYMIHSELPEIIQRRNYIELKNLFFEIEIMQSSREGKIITDSISVASDRYDPAAFSNIIVFLISDCFMYIPYILENSDDSRKQINELSSFPDGTEKDTVYLENLTQDDIENDDIIIITQKLLQFQLQQMIDNYNSNSSQDSLAELLMSYKKHFKKDGRLMEVMRQLANSQINYKKDEQKSEEIIN